MAEPVRGEAPSTRSRSGHFARPKAGRSPNSTENPRNRGRSRGGTSGSDIPEATRPERASRRGFGRAAQKTPIGIPRMRATAPRERELHRGGEALREEVRHRRPCRSDIPKSPVRALPRKRRYCTITGSASPQRRRFRASWVLDRRAWAGASGSTGSPMNFFLEGVRKGGRRDDARSTGMPWKEAREEDP